MPLNEAETRSQYIYPALQNAGWEATGCAIREEFQITAGRILGKGQRGKQLKADYVLEYKGVRLAVVEAKAFDKNYTDGVSQAKDYSTRLGIRFAYSTNGQKIYSIDMESGAESDINAFPSPDELWNLRFPQPNSWLDTFAKEPYRQKSGNWSIRYYQAAAVDKATAAIASGKKRVLLTLATGTGKTTIAFQIAWKLFQAKWTLQQDRKRRPRILFLADRNILANQAFNDFSSFMAFQEDALVRISPDEIKKKGYVPKNGSVFFTIFQTFMSGMDADGNPAPYFGDYPPDFFDCIIIDECHRGGAKDESTWRNILEYFSPALQIGLTATPKRDANVDTYKYFNDPVYVYSLKEGIEDGFLTPFKLRQIASTIDDYTYTPDDIVLEGDVEDGQHFSEKDFNVTIEIREREELRVKQLLEEMNPHEKTIIFCANQRHAALIRDIVNQLKTVNHPDYCARVTADEGKLGEGFLGKFQENDKTIPTILTTSHKLSTGVDALNVRNIVLLRPIKNMIEFKQIIGRGTRLFDGKDYFTIYDFVGAHALFHDEAWDGEPVAPDPKPEPGTPPEGGEIPEPPTEEPTGGDGEEGGSKPLIRVKLADGKERNFHCIKATSFWGPDGKLLTAKEFLESLYGKLPAFFQDEDELRKIWSAPDTRKKLLEGLQEKGFALGALKDLQKMINAEKSDLYDVLSHVAFSSPMELRVARAEQAKKRYPATCSDPQKAFLDFVLAQYVKEGFTELGEDKLPALIKAKYGESIQDGLADLGEADAIRKLFIEAQQWIYE